MRYTNRHFTYLLYLLTDCVSGMRLLLSKSPLYNSLQWLREEREIRYRSVVLHLAGVQSALLQQWKNYGSLEVRRKTTNSQRLVAQQRNERRQQCLHVLHQPCWNRVELTGLTRWWTDQLFHFVSSHWRLLVQGPCYLLEGDGIIHWKREVARRTEQRQWAHYRDCSKIIKGNHQRSILWHRLLSKL